MLSFPRELERLQTAKVAFKVTDIGFIWKVAYYLLLAFRCISAEPHAEIVTRSSSAAEGPRDALCQSKSCRLQLHSCRNSTTNPQQIELMGLEGYSRPTCNQLTASTTTRLDHRRCDPQARPSTNYVNNTIHVPRRNFFTSRSCTNEFRVELLSSCSDPNFLTTQRVRYVEGRLDPSIRFNIIIIIIDIFEVA